MGSVATKRGVRGILVGVAVALLVVACGEDGSEAGAEPTASDTPSATDTPSPSGSPSASVPTPTPFRPEMQVYEVPGGSGPHDVAPATDGGVWYTAQQSGELGYLDPDSGETRHVDLGPGARPHGVIVGPDGAPWITDGGLNAIVRVDPDTDQVRAFDLPADRPGANLNTAAFDGRGRLWFTGQSGVYGRLNPATGNMAVFDAPQGAGPYGITSTPDGDIWFVSLAGSYLANIDLNTDEATVIEPSTPDQGARRIWSDSSGRLWVSEWNAGQVSVYDPTADGWEDWRLPGDDPQAYSVYVDERNAVWLTDFGSNAIVRFDPQTERFREFSLPGEPGEVRQMLGREGEVWAPESATDHLVVIRY
jgi:virginiamycin B lyase